MRSLCLLLLVVANIAFFIFSQVYTSKEAPAGQRAEQIEQQPKPVDFKQVQRPPPAAEASAAQASATQARAASRPERPPMPTCLEWAGISPQDSDRSRQLLASIDASYEVVSGGTPTGPYWVRIRGVESRAAVDGLTKQLETAGERDSALSYDAENGTYVISLGLFANRANAERLHARVRHMGAVMTPEGILPISYLVRDVDGNAASKISAAMPSFPGATTSAVACPEPRATESAPS